MSPLGWGGGGGGGDCPFQGLCILHSNFRILKDNSGVLLGSGLHFIMLTTPTIVQVVVD